MQHVRVKVPVKSMLSPTKMWRFASCRRLQPVRAAVSAGQTLRSTAVRPLATATPQNPPVIDVLNTQQHAPVATPSSPASEAAAGAGGAAADGGTGDDSGGTGDDSGGTGDDSGRSDWFYIGMALLGVTVVGGPAYLLHLVKDDPETRRFVEEDWPEVYRAIADRVDLDEGVDPDYRFVERWDEGALLGACWDTATAST